MHDVCTNPCQKLKDAWSRVFIPPPTNATRPLPTVCNKDEFPCLSQGCVPLSDRCNGYPDCSDGSDEQNCPTLPPPTSTERPYLPITCAIGQRPCLSGNQCIYSQQWCNNRVDCNDLSDEAHCSKLRSSEWFPWKWSHPFLVPGTDEGLNLKTYPSSQDIKESEYGAFGLSSAIDGETYVLYEIYMAVFVHLLMCKM